MKAEDRDKILFTMSRQVGEIHVTVQQHTEQIATLNAKMDGVAKISNQNSTWIKALRIAGGVVAAAAFGAIGFFHKP